jgi:hypothetical protein
MVCLALLLLVLLAGGVRADLDILVLGSSHSYSENARPSGMAKEKPFDMSAVADELRKILSKDRAIREKVNVVFQDTHLEKVVHTDVAGWKTPQFRCKQTQYKAHTLAQYYLWPDGKDKRYENLRGKAGTA